MKKILGIFFIIFFSYGITSSANIVEELTKLNNLYKEGAITKEEFNKAKEIIFKSESSENTIQPDKVEKNKKKQTNNKKKKQKN